MFEVVGFQGSECWEAGDWRRCCGRRGNHRWCCGGRGTSLAEPTTRKNDLWWWGLRLEGSFALKGLNRSRLPLFRHQKCHNSVESGLIPNFICAIDRSCRDLAFEPTQSYPDFKSWLKINEAGTRWSHVLCGGAGAYSEQSRLAFRDLVSKTLLNFIAKKRIFYNCKWE